MTTFENVQQVLADLLGDSADLKYEINGQERSLVIVPHLGRTADEQAVETALNDSGVALVVTVPLKAKLIDLRANVAQLEVEIAVLLQLNPERNDPVNNPTAANKGIYDLIRAVTRTILARRTVNPNDAFGLAEEPLSLDLFDPGLFRYELVFTKRCVL